MGLPAPPQDPVSRRSLIEVENLHIDFPRSDGTAVHAVNGVNLVVGEGETLGIVGESGCGKSTVARALVGLIPAPGRVGAGRIRVDGLDLQGASARRLRRMRGATAAMVFQDPLSALNPVMTIGAQIEEALATHLGMSRRERRDRAVSLLSDVGISDPVNRAKAYPHQLSGGMRQRALIAMALACRPRLLIADEPTTALDVTIQAQILSLLKTLVVEHGTALIMITHDLGVVAGLCDEVNVLYGGRVVERADRHELFAGPRHPYTHGLLESIPRLDAGPGERLTPIVGSVSDNIPWAGGCAFAPRCSREIDRCRQVTPVLEPAPEAAADHLMRCHNPVVPVADGALDLTKGAS